MSSRHWHFSFITTHLPLVNHVCVRAESVSPACFSFSLHSFIPSLLEPTQRIKMNQWNTGNYMRRILLIKKPPIILSPTTRLLFVDICVTHCPTRFLAVHFTNKLRGRRMNAHKVLCYLHNIGSGCWTWEWKMAEDGHKLRNIDMVTIPVPSPSMLVRSQPTSINAAIFFCSHDVATRR